MSEGCPCFIRAYLEPVLRFRRRFFCSETEVELAGFVMRGA